jgi:integrase
MGLRWGDVDLDDACLTLHQTKNGERRVIPLVGQALQLLQKRRGVVSTTQGWYSQVAYQAGRLNSGSLG